MTKSLIETGGGRTHGRHRRLREIGSGDGALAARDITKAFPGALANDGVEFEIAKGEVHALLGENDSGKTTLCKVLTGLYRPDAGQVVADGQPVHFASPAEAYAAGISMVHQHFGLVSPMTVAEYVVLGWTREAAWRFNRRQDEDEIASAAGKFGLAVDPGALVARLSDGEKLKSRDSEGALPRCSSVDP